MRHYIKTILVVSIVALSTGYPSQSKAQDAHMGHMEHASHKAVPDKPWSQADQYFDPAEMEASRQQVQSSHGGTRDLFLMADRLETQMADGEEVLLWDAQGWYGGDINKFWFKTEGEYAFDEDKFEEAELQALWSRAITPYFDFQAGLRYDILPGDDIAHGVIGIQGLAPQWWEIDAAAFISDEGDVTARIEAENDLLLTQRLILQPRVEVEFAAQDIPELDKGAGVTQFDAGLRLRYEIKREFAPYVGVEWQRNFGETANLVEAAGGDSERTVFLVGLRLWF